MTLDDILKNIRGFASGVGNFIQQNPTPASFIQKQIAPPVISPVPTPSPMQEQMPKIQDVTRTAATNAILPPLALTDLFTRKAPQASAAISDFGQNHPSATEALLKAEKPLTAVKDRLANPYNPVAVPDLKLSSPNPVVNTGAKVVNKVANTFIKPVVEGAINAPTNFIGGTVRTGLDIGRAARGDKVTPQTFLADSGAIAKGIMDASVVTSLLPNLAKKSAEAVGSRTIGEVVKEGAIGGAKFGAGYGAAQSLIDNKDVKDAGVYITNLLMSTGENAAGGAIFGGGVAGASYLGGKILGTAYKFFKEKGADDQTAATQASKWVRDEFGRFSKKVGETYAELQARIDAIPVNNFTADPNVKTLGQWKEWYKKNGQTGAIDLNAKVEIPKKSSTVGDIGGLTKISEESRAKFFGNGIPNGLNSEEFYIKRMQDAGFNQNQIDSVLQRTPSEIRLGKKSYDSGKIVDSFTDYNIEVRSKLSGETTKGPLGLPSKSEVKVGGTGIIPQDQVQSHEMKASQVEMDSVLRNMYSKNTIADFNVIKTMARAKDVARGDVETLYKKNPKLAERAFQAVKEMEPNITSNDEAFQYILDLPTKADTVMPKAPKESFGQGDIAYNAQATPETRAKTAKIEALNRQKAAMAADKEWRRAIAEKYNLDTPKQKENKNLRKITASIKENTNDGLPPIPDIMPTKKHTAWDSVKDFGKSLVLTSRKILSDMGTMGTEAAKRIDTFHNNYRKMAGGAIADYQQVTRGLGEKSIENINRFLDGQNVTLSSQEAKAATMMRAMLDNYGSQAHNAQLQIVTGDGKKIPFSMRENYLPHIVDVEKLKANAPAAIEHFVSTGQMNQQTAAQFVSDIANGANVGDTYRKYFPNVLPKKYGNLETARLLDWSPEVLRYDKALLPDYFDAAGKRIQGAITFGPNNELVDKMMQGIAKEGGNTSLAEDILGRNLGYKQDPQFVTQASSVIRQAQGAAKLGLSAVSNASQSVNTATVFGIRRTLKNVIPALTSPEARDFVERTGTVTDQTMQDMQAEIAGGKGLLSRITAPGFGFVERLNRTIAANTGKTFAQDMFARLQSNPTDVAAIKSLEKMGIDAAAAMKNGSLSQNDLITAGQKGVDLTQFKIDPIDSPPLWASSGAKIITQFKNFAYQQGKFIINEVAKEAGKGNLAPLGRYLLLGAIVGEPLADIKAAIRGQTRPTGVARIANNIQQVGGGGILSDAVNAIDGGASKISSFIMGPTVSDVVTTTANIGSAAKGKPLPLAKQALNAIPVVGGPIANRAIPSTKAAAPTDKIDESAGGVNTFLSDKTDLSATDQAAIDEQIKNLDKQRKDVLANTGTFGFGKMSESEVQAKVDQIDKQKEALQAMGVYKDIKKINEMPTATPYDQQTKRDKAFTYIDNVQKLPKDMQAEALKKLGISQNEADYFTIAKGDALQKYEYVKDQATSVDKIIPFLITVNGKKIASSDVITKLYDDGVISKQEMTYLNALRWDEKAQKFELSRTYQTSQSGAGLAKKKAKLKDLFEMSQQTLKAQVELAKPSQKRPSRSLDSVLQSRAPSTTGLSKVLALYRKTADTVRHLKKK